MGYILVSRLQPQNSKIQSMLDIQEGTDVVAKIKNNIINQYVQNGAFYSTIINIIHYSAPYIMGWSGILLYFVALLEVIFALLH